MGIGNWVTTRLRVRHLAGVLRSSASTQQARREAADELATMGGPAVPALVACLDHATEAVRDCAAAANARRRPHRGVQPQKHVGTDLSIATQRRIR